MKKVQPETLRLQAVKDRVKLLYEQSDREMAHWIWENHVSFVANKAAELSDKFGGNGEKAVIGALLHDLGDVWMDRADEGFEEKTEAESKLILQETGFTEKETLEILQEIVGPHSCYPENMPKTLEGKILATADALAHLMTNFYREMQQMGLPKRIPSHEFHLWASKKIERDFNDKIFFEEIREEVRSKYEALRSKYSQ